MEIAEAIKNQMEQIASRIPPEQRQAAKTSKSSFPKSREEALQCSCDNPSSCPYKGYIPYEEYIEGYGTVSKLLECPTYKKYLQQIWIKNKIEQSLPEKHREHTFENFEPRSKDSAKALKIARRYLAKQAWRQGANVVLLGKYGAGKTHIAAAVVHAAIEEFNTAAFVNAPRLNEGGFEAIEQRFEYLSVPDLVVIDDLSNETDNKLINRHLYTLVNNRYETEKGLMITANLSIDAFREVLGERIFDRFRERTAFLRINDVESYREKKRKKYLEWMEGE